jgi:hypothetical protein
MSTFGTAPITGPLHIGRIDHNPELCPGDRAYLFLGDWPLRKRYVTVTAGTTRGRCGFSLPACPKKLPGFVIAPATAANSRLKRGMRMRVAIF